MNAIFHNRHDAGRKLAEKLSAYAGRKDVIVLALPRGGVPVGYEVARALRAPLDVFVARKLGVPGREELAMGAIASGGIRVINQEVVTRLANADAILKEVTASETAEVERRERMYRKDRSAQDCRRKTIVLVDDGIATGATMRAAVTALRGQNAAKIIVAVPVAVLEACAEFGKEADEVICGFAPETLFAVGQFYEDFTQITDDEVRSLLASAAQEWPPMPTVPPRFGEV